MQRFTYKGFRVQSIKDHGRYAIYDVHGRFVCTVADMLTARKAIDKHGRDHTYVPRPGTFRKVGPNGRERVTF